MANIESQTIQLVADFFDMGLVSSYSRLGGWANKNYHVCCGDNQYVIKLLQEHNNEDARSEVSYSEYVRKAGFSTVEFLFSKKGDDALYVGDGVTALAMKFIKGEKPTQDIATLTIIGETLARLHSIPLDNSLSRRNSWFRSEYLPEAIKDIGIKYPVDAGKFRSAYQQLNKTLDKLPRSLIHGDLGPENCLLVNGSLVLLDWEEVTIGPSILDLAMTMLYVCYEPFENLKSEYFIALLKGYNSVRQLTEQEISLLPDAIRFSGLTITAWNKLDDDEWGELYWKRNLHNKLALPGLNLTTD